MREPVTGFMSSYRCYLFDPRGVVIATEDFEGQSDAEALSAARRLCRDRGADRLELWQRPRLLHSEQIDRAAAPQEKAPPKRG